MSKKYFERFGWINIGIWFIFWVNTCIWIKEELNYAFGIEYFLYFLLLIIIAFPVQWGGAWIIASKFGLMTPGNAIIEED